MKKKKKVQEVTGQRMAKGQVGEPIFKKKKLSGWWSRTGGGEEWRG